MTSADAVVSDPGPGTFVLSVSVPLRTRSLSSSFVPEYPKDLGRGLGHRPVDTSLTLPTPPLPSSSTTSNRAQDGRHECRLRLEGVQRGTGRNMRLSSSQVGTFSLGGRKTRVEPGTQSEETDSYSLSRSPPRYTRVPHVSTVDIRDSYPVVRPVHRDQDESSVGQKSHYHASVGDHR